MINTKAGCFEDLVVWQKSHPLVLRVYDVTRLFPRTEVYGLTSQIRGAAVSVPANIAEGFKRLGKSDKLRFLNISQGSLEEVRYYLILAQDLGYLKDGRIREQLEEVGRVLDGYCRAIQRDVATRKATFG